MSEIGVIGQTYEDRRTKKKGKLVERDDKYKTLLMESEDGKSFNVSFGGFKSNWRKCDEPEVTMEEALQEVEVPEEKPKEKVVEKKPRKKYKEQQVSSGYEDITLHILDYVKSFNNVRVSSDIVPTKRRITLKVDNRRIYIITYMVRNDLYQIYSSEPMFLLLRDKEYVKEAKYNETWPCLKYSFYLDKDMIDMFLEDARAYIVDFMCK